MYSPLSSVLLVACLVAVLGASGCGPLGISASDPREIHSAGEVVGEYAFPFENGPVEVLILREDLTFRQELFADLPSYKAFGAPKYSLEGGWSYKGAKIRFEPFLSFFEFPHLEKFRQSPVEFSGTYGYWVAPSDTMDAMIELYAEKGYIAARIADRSKLFRVGR